jgi:hypothetical protein
MKSLIRGLLTSKKFVTAVAATAAAALLKLGWEVDTEAILAIISPLITYLLGQGLADIGKHANGN